MPKLPDSNMNMKEIMRLAGTDTGKQLIAMLRRERGPELDAAMKKAAAGDYRPLQHTVSEFLSTPAARELLNKLRG